MTRPAPRRTSFAMDCDPPPKTPPSDREARLAAQLRANLRRRKAPPPPKPADDTTPQDG